ncbi:MAG: iron-sulfur cluster assembly scaffold protein [Pyrinomonadaceae bacterium]
MSIYPPKIAKRFDSQANSGSFSSPSAMGSEVDFSCGVSLKFSLQIDPETKTITAAKFRTNGCGFVIAAADLLSENITGSALIDLHALQDQEKELQQEFGGIPENRLHCFGLAMGALQNALAEYRNSQAAEWEGEKALICTCFGISEEVIEKTIADENLSTVEEVGASCNAGMGCGSCQFLIREILDTVS